MRSVGVALLGLGTVGSGVAKLLLEHHDRIARRVGLSFELRHVVVRDTKKKRPANVPAEIVTTDYQRVCRDPKVEIAVELMGGVTPTRQALIDLLQAGKDVVTANKALLAEHGPEIFDCAHTIGRSIAFEASVGGGIPIIAAVGECLVANQIVSITGILNGTSNYILTAMTETGEPYATALARAQQLGYAEADPAFDVDGTDAAHKLAILAQLGFGSRVSTAQITRAGIDRLDAVDVRYAAQLGYTIKLLATARLTDGAIALTVAPTLVRHHTPLAEVRGAYNAIQVVGDAVGDTLFYGRGAGQMPTASAVVADIIDTAVGRAALTFRTLRLWTDPDVSALPVATPDKMHGRYYLRFQVEDRPGVLAQLARALGDHTISIASVIQPEAAEERQGAAVPLIFMTHNAVDANVRAALAEIDRLTCLKLPSVCMRVEG
jgi:homoserine dehydrogenase